MLALIDEYGDTVFNRHRCRNFWPSWRLFATARMTPHQMFGAIVGARDRLRHLLRPLTLWRLMPLLAPPPHLFYERVVSVKRWKSEDASSRRVVTRPPHLTSACPSFRRVL